MRGKEKNGVAMIIERNVEKETKIRASIIKFLKETNIAANNTRDNAKDKNVWAT